MPQLLFWLATPMGGIACKFSTGAATTTLPNSRGPGVGLLIETVEPLFTPIGVPQRASSRSAGRASQAIGVGRGFPVSAALLPPPFTRVGRQG